MQTTRTHNAYHLGDNLVHLHFLRKVALANPDREFVHALQWQYILECDDVIADIPNISLTDFNYALPSDSIDAWRGSNHFWYRHPDRDDFVRFHLKAWFPHLCARMRIENPMKSPADMLFDYPAIESALNGAVAPECEVLVINNVPGSGQFLSYDQYKLAIIADAIAAKGFAVVVTDEWPKNLISTKRLNYSVTKIGTLSKFCDTILMVSTGPSWPTFNIWNQESVKNRIILLDNERVNLSPNTTHCRTIEEARDALKGAGLL